ncbi:hypothetical protein LPJ71_010137 [Coemansia sp. S17]|nr:hypothetical protein LPJ71_010137 [Coemansia sp. S17]
MTVGRSPHDDRKPRSSTAYRSNTSPNSSPSPSPSPNASPSRQARIIDVSEVAIASASTLTRPPRPPRSYSSSAASSDNERRADSARGSVATYATSGTTGGANATASDAGVALATAASSSGATDYWKEDLSNLLTPQTVVEQAQVQRRKRNREAARRSRLKQKERERELVERQANLSERLNFLKQELVEWRTMNANLPNRVRNVSAVADTSQQPSSPQPTALLPQQLLQLIDPTLILDSDDDELVDGINRVYELILDTLRIIGELQLHLDDITKELNEMIGSSL